MTTSTVRAFHARLLQEHAEIDDAIDGLIRAYESGDHEVARTAFRELDNRLMAHLAMEDDLILPAFADVDPVEAEQISLEHRAIRAKVEELVVGSDLHLTRLSAVRLLAEALRAHAKREDETLYRWIDRSYGDTQIPTAAVETHAYPIARRVP